MDWLKYKNLYFIISIILIGIGAFSIINWGLRLGVDFTGGSVLEYSFEEEISTEMLTEAIENQGVEVAFIQQTQDNSYFIKLPPISPDEKDKVASAAAELVNTKISESTASASLGFEELRFETVGPSVGPELVKKTVYAIGLAAAAILLWVAYQFKSFKFGISAILAMFHDSFILVGAFSLLGYYFGAEVDFLFVTALLTTLSFSVHDTIVVFDRIREISGKISDDLEADANQALTETMVRSLNNSFTIIFMLVALLLLGGTTIKWFAAALLIGTILGTYSSPFVAVPLLTTFDKLWSKIKKN